MAEPDGYAGSYEYWLGYMLRTVKQSAREGDEQALRSLQLFCDESTIALDIDREALHDITREKAA